ncbi:MAG: hypothetical protein ACI93R_003592 [Flavobacteriales bacterium]|jgi:hypothetical protein
MQSSDKSFNILIVGLILAGVFFTAQRHMTADVPWFPGKTQRVWSIEARITFDALGESVRASFAIPSTQPGFDLIGERTASPGYGLGYVEHGRQRRADWSNREAIGGQTFYYQADIVEKDFPRELNSTPPTLKEIDFIGPEGTVALAMLDKAKTHSADAYSLTRELFSEFSSDEQQTQFLLQSAEKKIWLVDFLHQSKVPARIVKVLNLEDGRRRQDLVSYLQVFSNDGDYQLFNVATGAQGQNKNQILWEQYGAPIFDLIGGEHSKVSFSMISKKVPIKKLTEQHDLNQGGVLNFALHSLPLEEQTVFKGILLLPIGVLVVVFFRIFIGIRTSGTFMPVLIALCFIQTSLLVGLIGFVLIVGGGLFLRAYLSRHNLLLVARISTVIICVILMITLFAILAFRLGLSEGLKVTFFPMIILSWTIERMSILWEEEGPKEVFTQAGGSLLIAVIVYSLMSNDIVRHLTFNFIGLQFVFIALVLLCGSYTGYRLLEIQRFRSFLEKIG